MRWDAAIVAALASDAELLLPYLVARLGSTQLAADRVVLDMLAPRPRDPVKEPPDTFFTGGPDADGAPRVLDIRDPRCRYFFRLDDGQMDVDRLKRGSVVAEPTVSASMATARVMFWRQQYDGVLDQCRKVYQLDPNFPDLYLMIGRTYGARAQYQEAITALERGRRFAQDDPRLLSALGYTYACAGQAEDAERSSEELGELTKSRYVSALDIALIYAGLGLHEWVECCVDRAREERSVGLLWWDLDPEWTRTRQGMQRKAGAV